MAQNKMGVVKLNKLIWSMGIPMVFSMILQAIYNVVDTIFVVNKAELGQAANQALTFAFPVQILLIAVGVGTGVGLNALLSKYLGEGKKEEASKAAGVGIFIGIVVTLIFVLFGLFGAKPYMEFMARNIDQSIYDQGQIVEWGSEYLSICCVYSVGAIGYAVYERFLQSTGKTMLSTIAQVSGAVINIFGDWLLIYVFELGVAGAAIATVVGQIASLVIAMVFHYFKNKEINGHPKHIRPSWKITKAIYQIGLPAMIMQGLLAVMMFVTIEIIGTSKEYGTILQGAFGIYYKIMQIALFASFGLSNTLISIVSFNYGMNDKMRVQGAIKFGIIDSVIVSLVITALFQVLAEPISNLFGLTLGPGSDDVIRICVNAMHIATIGYVFMAISVAIQGILQGFRSVYLPLIISLLRLIVFVVPFAFLFMNIGNPYDTFWWTFPIAEFLTAIISVIFLLFKCKKLNIYEKQKEEAKID